MRIPCPQDYNPSTGRVQGRYTDQGLAPNSTWARGQAWAISGFAYMWGATRDQRMLAAARKVADWWLRNIPADKVRGCT